MITKMITKMINKDDNKDDKEMVDQWSRLDNGDEQTRPSSGDHQMTAGPTGVNNTAVRAVIITYNTSTNTKIQIHKYTEANTQTQLGHHKSSSGVVVRTQVIAMIMARTITVIMFRNNIMMIMTTMIIMIIIVADHPGSPARVRTLMLTRHFLSRATNRGKLLQTRCST